MSKIIVSKECGCFKKSDFENNMSFSSKDDALISAQSMVRVMNNDFCGKHEFTLSDDGTDMYIDVQSTGGEESHTGCCGGGHCS